MTLNGVVAVFLRYFTDFGRFGANYVTWLKLGPLQQSMKSSFRKYMFYVDNFQRILRETVH